MANGFVPSWNGSYMTWRSSGKLPGEFPSNPSKRRIFPAPEKPLMLDSGADCRWVLGNQPGVQAALVMEATQAAVPLGKFRTGVPSL
jgi:hypothetical protein